MQVCPFLPNRSQDLKNIFNSGCITSAESVLITLQSHTEVMSVLSDEKDERVAIVSFAPQSLASLAAVYSCSEDPLTPRKVLHRMREFCTEILGFAYVFDTTFARQLALEEHVKEFAERRRGTGEGLGLPMLASACPGWICYAEKTHSEMLPFIARTKSPQQVMGTLVKKWIGEKIGKK